ncbi:DUF2614 family zinc ribbon-containing protein [Microaerobacter geothermalis]|uniref:DUF2614 family zinc ribbon-containing protein n=1 Tax=Microaerobacter geothermalis TaxID=674972 RepID=UPI002E30AF28|nr:DUF2614 family zinc ribbon-containing protein [Microaerobacter geothermalis]
MSINKIARFRSLALFIIFISIVIMYLALFFKSSYLIMAIIMTIGFILLIGSTIGFFWVGMVSTTKTVQVTCPKCGKVTKMLKKVDQCMFCNQTLSLDPIHAKNNEDHQ